MRNFLLLLSMFLLMDSVNAAAVRRLFQDQKLPTQQVLERIYHSNLAAASSVYVANGIAGNSTVTAVTTTTGLTNPDQPRNLTIQVNSSATEVAACTITVTGKNIFNQTITEDFTFINNQSSAVTGNKAFKNISSVAFPANCEDGSYTATWNIGIGEKIGLHRCMEDAGDWVQSSVDGVFESTRATVVAHTSSVDRNTVDYNGTMNGTSDFKGYFMQNFRCFP